jgi:glycosyltransferase involved in cell wall biosynthesis
MQADDTFDLSPHSDPHLESEEWLTKFKRKHGRPLRVLHIGNIANNAYNNAKIQRDRGIAADVLSFDYYHIMACPEWEDSAFEGNVGDPFFPDWWSVDCKGFCRPRWFVAGPLDACIRYLLAKTAGKGSERWLWRTLMLEVWLLSHRGRFHDLVNSMILKFTGHRVTYLTAPANALIMTMLGRKLATAGEFWALRSTPIGHWLRWMGARFARFGRTANICEDAPRHLRKLRHTVCLARERANFLLSAVGRGGESIDFESVCRWWWHPYLSLLFRRYDLVQCYATYTTLPFFIAHSNYIAYEHGTIRSIPFTATDEGRLCMASYRAASNVLVTNIDNLDAAAKMRLDPQRITCLPHAFNSDKLVQFAASARVPQPAADRVVTFVMPARQHWVDNDPGWAKGNDRVFAALRLLKDQGKNCQLRAVAWGNDVEASRARISALDIEHMVQWIPVMKKRELWLEYLNSHAVIDQFVVPAFGGVTFEAMMLERRVITFIDQDRAKQFFGAAPPLFACRTAREIAAAMCHVLDDAADTRGDGRANREWMQRFHSADRIVSLQAAVYRRSIKEAGKADEAGSAAGGVSGAGSAPVRQPSDSLSMKDCRQSIRPFYVARTWNRRTKSDEIVMLVVSALRIDPRVEREARALAAHGWRVRIVAPDISSPSLAEQPVDWGGDVTFHLLPYAAANYIMQAPWLTSEAMYEAAMAFKPFAYHCHDLNTALIGLRAARDNGARCVCDFHEWSSENVTWSSERARWEPHTPEKRLLFRWVERLALRCADEIITVNDSIAREFELLGRSVQGRVKVIRNIPLFSATPTRSYPPLKAQLGLRQDSFVVLYQGGTGPTRLLEPVIEALALAPNVTLVIRGPSLELFGEGYRATARRFGVEKRLVLADPVPSCDVVAAARGADAGLWTLPNLSKNFFLALPNKIFEYLASGLPLLVAHFPEAMKIADQGGVGLWFDPYDPTSIATQMRHLADNPEFAATCRAAVPRALATLDADNEWDRFASIYDELRAATISV